MKQSLYFASIAAICALFVSCTENDSVKEIKSSTDTPSIVVSVENNLCDVVSGSATGAIRTNVNVISGVINATGGQMTANPESFSFKAVNSGNTYDCLYCLIQDFSNGNVWYDYGSYGFVETPICFRVRGAKGTLAPAFDAEKDDPTKNNYYVSGVVTEMKDLDSKDLKFSSIAAISGYFKKWDYSIVDTYKADFVALTIKTAGDVVVTVNVYGKQRDNEIAGLKKYIKVGDTVEIPANAASSKDLAAKKLKDILFCQVLKIK